MLKTDLLEDHPDLDVLLAPKKKIHELMQKVNGSMITYMKEIKDLKSIENLATDYFAAKKRHKEIRARSSGIRFDELTNRIKDIKNLKINTTDFI